MNKEDTKKIVFPKPFLKWAGGKRQLLKELSKAMPKNYEDYFEPFIGGGAFFFSLQPKGGFISDINPELIMTYQVIRSYPEELIKELKKYRNTEKDFYKIRNQDRKPAFKKLSKRKKEDRLKKAARCIYLNKTAFNGLYRMNSKGEFNAPYGFYKNPKIVDAENIRACSKLLQQTEIRCCSFTAIKSRVKKGDFVYFDPPYVPLSTTSSFTKYFKDDFNANMQVKLKELCDYLDKKGVQFMLSNSDSKLVRELYAQDYNIKTVKAIRAINCKGDKRGKINEIIVTNY